jgi:hypothetical protein
MIKLTQDGHDIYLFGEWDDVTEKRGHPRCKSEDHGTNQRNRDIILSVLNGGKPPFRIAPSEAIYVLRRELLSQITFRGRVTELLRKTRDALWTLGQEERAAAPIAGDMGTSYAAGKCEGMHVGIMVSSQSISDVLDSLAIDEKL